MGLEVHMDDVHGVAAPAAREQFMKDVATHVIFKGGEEHKRGVTYDHLKRLRTPYGKHTRLQPNDKYLAYALREFGLEDAKAARTPGVPGHRAALAATPLAEMALTDTGLAIMLAVMYPLPSLTLRSHTMTQSSLAVQLLAQSS